MALEVQATAVRIAEAATRAGSFDAVADLARPYSLTVVGDLVGLPEHGQRRTPPWPSRRSTCSARPVPEALKGSARWPRSCSGPSTPTNAVSWRRGSRGEDLCRRGLPMSIVSYTWPGIDTTVNALAAAVLLFARYPDQWDAVRDDRSLIPAAFNEVLRLHAPVQFFSRFVPEDTGLAGVTLPAGTRVLVMYGSANRDERRYPDPDRFDVRRDTTGQLSFGRGIHLCVGIHLARLEAAALLNALADRVARFELSGEPRWLINNTLHGPEFVPVRAIPAP